ncbi:hypothetical protein SAMN05421504_10413 [Amycolatopsis xylanica]|uniref:Uncharacterized protein n=1 Tax=Amycolatopsis xylanica TaxID=589385 RepID=A0A1H3FXM2_9PSEU|nr:hypothetical protein [Amycolatopsis xylanica]SDX94914.1 hypothetical protein SAMN05421504_10413 [Amycolatopsis xylanica]
MRRGGMVTTLGLIGSLLGILGFLGVQTYHDLERPARAPASSVVRQVDVPAQDNWDYIHLADDACAAAVARVGEANKYANSGKLFVSWAKKVGELRADLLGRWKQTATAGRSAALANETAKVWSDYANANWHWTEMTKQVSAGRLDAARGQFDQYRKYDDSAVQRANQLGYSICNYAWARPVSW